MYDYELSHYGVLGMKWGVRKDRTNVNANPKVKKLKDKVDEEKRNYKIAEKYYNKKTGFGSIPNKDAENVLNKARRQLQYAKEDLSDEKTRIKVKNQNNKTKRQLNFEEKYKEKGMTDGEAEIAAYKRVKTEKVIALTAGLTFTAATAYVAYKHYDNTVDKIIKEGTILQNISTNSNRGVDDAFYVSFTKKDNKEYMKGFAYSLSEGGDKEIYKTRINVDKDLKIANTENATKILKNIVSDDNSNINSLKQALLYKKKTLGGLISPEQDDIIKKALNSLDKKTVNSDVYEAYNLTLDTHTVEGEKLSKTFYNALKNEGYGALKDLNDSKYSGYRTKQPHIIFEAVDKISIKDIREITPSDRKNARKGDIITNIASLGVFTGSVMGGKKIITDTANSAKNTLVNDKIVSDYKKKHPNMNLSYKEIVRNYYK